jgi:formylglycine-generating enzyme required for sulfatase activity
MTAGEDYPATVTVGNPNNLPDDTGYGSVSYPYKIGKYEVTNAQYCEFLNAADKTGKFALWRWQMAKADSGAIHRSGSAGNFTYTVVAGWENKPAVLVNWYETLRFCNWLSNGKGASNIDKGPYTFKDDWGELSVKLPDHAKLAKGDKVQWVLASEDEWYKAAYYDAKKNGGGGYYSYPGGSDVPGESNLGSGQLMEVGGFDASPYGTYDQGGNAWEWNETRQNGKCGVRGGSYFFNDSAPYTHANTRYVTNPPTFIYDNYGFRVVALGTEDSSAKPAATEPAAADK